LNGKNFNEGKKEDRKRELKRELKEGKNADLEEKNEKKNNEKDEKIDCENLNTKNEELKNEELKNEERNGIISEEKIEKKKIDIIKEESVDFNSLNVSDQNIEHIDNSKITPENKELSEVKNVCVDNEKHDKDSTNSLNKNESVVKSIQHINKPNTSIPLHGIPGNIPFMNSLVNSASTGKFWKKPPPPMIGLGRGSLPLLFGYKDVTPQSGKITSISQQLYSQVQMGGKLGPFRPTGY
jgi:hypothetical protein